MEINKLIEYDKFALVVYATMETIESKPIINNIIFYPIKTRASTSLMPMFKINSGEIISDLNINWKEAYAEAEQDKIEHQQEDAKDNITYY